MVADTVNPLPITRAAWRAVAAGAQVPWVEIEVVCSDPVEHRRRVEHRRSDVAGLRLPTWDDVVQRPYEPRDEAHIVIDTAGQSVEQCGVVLQGQLAMW